MLKYLVLICSLSLFPPLVQAQSVTGLLVGGGGIDDMSLVIQAPTGKKYKGYCNDQCGDWFEETGNGEYQELKRAYLKRKVHVDLAKEINGHRIAGPGADDTLSFVKKIKFLD